MWEWPENEARYPLYIPCTNNNLLRVRTKVMDFIVLGLLCLLQAWSSSTQFVFEFELESVTTIFNNGTCDPVVPPTQEDIKLLGPCEPFLSTFCLREKTNTQNSDTGNCPLGRNDAGIIAYTPGVNLTGIDEQMAATRPGLPDGSVNRTITSLHPWPVRCVHIIIKLRYSVIILLIVGDISVIH